MRPSRKGPSGFGSGFGSSGEGDGAAGSNGAYDEGDEAAYSGGGGESCCPLVVDPITLLALLALIALGTYFLNIIITMKLGRRRRRDARQQSLVQEAIAVWTGTKLSRLIYLTDN